MHFTKAHQDWQLAQGTTQMAGYHGANDAMDSFVSNTADAFGNLATSTASDRQMLTNLTTTNKELTQQLAAKEAKISSLKTRLREQNKHPSHCHANRPTRDPTKRHYNNSNYCWTHGYDIHNTHASKNCNFPNEGHQHDATCCNTKGGSTANKDRAT
jgi:hypothetical protein